MAGAHHSVGQALAVIFYKSASAPFLQPCVELLQIVLRELAERYLAYFGDDMVIYPVFIALHRRLPDLGLGEVLKPEIHPIAKRNVRLESVCGTPALLLEGLELFLTFSLRFCGYACLRNTTGRIHR